MRFGLQFGFDDIASKRGNEHVVALPESGPSSANALGASGPRSNANQTHANEPFAQRLASETNCKPKRTEISARKSAHGNQRTGTSGNVDKQTAYLYNFR